jgi:hypothetical protein
MITHTDDCIHHPMYIGDDECEYNLGVWNQPRGWYVDEAQSQLEDAPWCAVHQRAWELQNADDNAYVS